MLVLESVLIAVVVVVVVVVVAMVWIIVQLPDRMHTHVHISYSSYTCVCIALRRVHRRVRQVRKYRSMYSEAYLQKFVGTSTNTGDKHCLHTIFAYLGYASIFLCNECFL